MFLCKASFLPFLRLFLVALASTIAHLTRGKKVKGKKKGACGMLPLHQDTIRSISEQSAAFHVFWWLASYRIIGSPRLLGGSKVQLKSVKRCARSVCEDYTLPNVKEANLSQQPRVAVACGRYDGACAHRPSSGDSSSVKLLS